LSQTLVTRSNDGAVATLTISRPKALNALNAQVLTDLQTHIAAIAADPAVRVLMLTGAGERAFVAGADISEFVGATPIDAMAISARLKSVADMLEAMPKPVVAVVNGFCLGGGMELALACDMRIASSNAMFGQPEIKLGVIPGGGGTVRLSKVAGKSVAMMLCLTGDPISADRAMGLGIVAAVHAPEALTEAAAVLGAKLAALPPFALAQVKSTLNRVGDMDVAAGVDFEMQAFALCYATADQAEGAQAFLEKRKPVFTGR
jgi:enoyl-CoA hydratase